MGRSDDYTQVVKKYLLTLDFSDKPKYVQLGIGGATGYATGVVAAKVGKAVALAAGGGFLLVNVVGARAGIVQLDWEKVEDELEEVTEEITEYLNSKKTKRFIDQVSNVVKKNVVTASGFAAGFFLGIAI